MLRVGVMLCACVCFVFCSRCVRVLLSSIGVALSGVFFLWVVVFVCGVLCWLKVRLCVFACDVLCEMLRGLCLFVCWCLCVNAFVA